MKSSLSSITSSADSHRLLKFLLLLFFFFLLFVSSANCSSSSPPTLPSPTSSSRNNLHHRYCDSFSHETPRSLCSQLQRIHHSLRPFPPQVKGVDTRYGVEKRLVPSGPNPLHN
ncbi:hypothetical protein L6164_027036 [Bauhinia variegata]|uniref:Uncharacterized protein n=1 Tax=Bauhinia variegata TaxID=167791 RepID=A0ACB9LSC3_BAUVA|nr:hypothetical protein L6164_027036 [Bauhinia variegata]